MVEVLYWTPNQNVRVLYDSSSIGGRYRVQNLVCFRLASYDDTVKRWDDARKFETLPEAIHYAEQMDDVLTYRTVDELPPNEDAPEYADFPF